MGQILAIKVDVDTLKGYLEGVPRLLDILAERKVRASFFFSMGPDNSGKAIRRIFRKGFLRKMLRTNAPGSYGLKTLFYGTLLRAPMIVASNPDVLRRAAAEGHECGIHCWDHVAWQDCLPSMSRQEIRAALDRAAGLFSEATGAAPKCCAAPGWQVSADSLSVQDDMGLDYASDARGTSPFLPRMDGHAFRTPQIPTTLPTLDEVWGADGIDDTNVVEYYMGMMAPDSLSVHTVHAEMEGGRLSGIFADLMARCVEAGVSFTTLGEAVKKSAAPVCDLEMAEIRGRAGKVAVQKL
ncbi:MAG: 4-deoxy-4-formamido-L-arabinose-phosphoundecaprenol deformylase [Synergistaceae bacterium]|jgi:peptidoglycan/xylan/chitin deacetylase (PgdA/CDA1 family)|nr:4-deoxy-4-formamido-L-arabinose-phosphoundecaprenol deformylase [Synergistaceae bacterium]